MNERKKALTALKTCQGQIEGIIGMIEEGRYCIDVSNQLLSAQAMIKRANKLILAGHMQSCVMDAIENTESAEVKLGEITDILNKLLS